MNNTVLHAVTVSESLIFLTRYAAHMKISGIRYVVSCSPDGHAFEWCKREGVEFLPVPMVRIPSPVADMKSLWCCIRQLHALKPSIVNAGTPKAGLIFMISAWLLRVPKRIYHVRGFRHESLHGKSRMLQQLVEKLCGFLATDVLLECDSLKDYAQEWRLFEYKKMFVIGSGSSGIEINRFAHVRKSLKDSSCLTIGFLGRLIPRKGIEELIFAWRILEKRYSNIRLLIGGDYDENQVLTRRFYDELALCKRVEILGHIEYDCVPNFMVGVDIFVLPAHWEGFGNVLIEAAATGVPVVSTIANGTVNAVQNMVNGILVPPKSVEDLVSAISLYLECPALRDLHSRQGPAWAARFDRDLIASMFAIYYKSYLTSRA